MTRLNWPRPGAISSKPSVGQMNRSLPYHIYTKHLSKEKEPWKYLPFVFFVAFAVRPSKE
jgi:hypothetical protein